MNFLRKKGQAEIIGFAIVIVLLIFALIFFVSVKNNEDNVDTTLIRTNLRANSALNALMKVSVNDEQMKDIIELCFIGNTEQCGLAHTSLDLKLKSIFEGEYYFKVVDIGGNILTYGNKKFEFGEDCRVSISASPYIFRNQGQVELKICT